MRYLKFCVHNFYVVVVVVFDEFYTHEVNLLEVILYTIILIFTILSTKDYKIFEAVIDNFSAEWFL